jgi:hypothetical protein
MSSKNKLHILLLVLACIFYAMQGVLINPFSAWVLSPLFIALLWSACSNASNLSKPLIAFITGNILVLSFFHVTWFFDISGAKTGSSTGALIFAIAPIYAYIVGGVFSLLMFLIQRRTKNA